MTKVIVKISWLFFLCAPCMWIPGSSKEGVGFPRTESINSCKPHVDSGNWIQVFYKSNTCSFLTLIHPYLLGKKKSPT